MKSLFDSCVLATSSGQADAQNETALPVLHVLRQVQSHRTIAKCKASSRNLLHNSGAPLSTGCRLKKAG